ncbi:MAG TPA: hypothetical protein VKA66_16855, partial [Mycobacterium sp.]|nr:hypothetical protein [Mycobacterium sp.]
HRPIRRIRLFMCPSWSELTEAMVTPQPGAHIGQTHTLYQPAFRRGAECLDAAHDRSERRHARPPRISSKAFTTGATAVDGLYLVVYQSGPVPTPNYNNTGSWTPVAWSPALNPLPAGLGSQPTTLSADPSQAADTTVTYPARITVKAGDVLGVAASCMDWYPSPSPTSSDFPFPVPFNAPQPTSPALPHG